MKIMKQAILAMVFTLCFQNLTAQPMDRKMTTSGRVKIAFTEAGKGDTLLLLLPGWCANRTVFDPMVPFMRQKHHVITMDWRSHGDSEKVKGEFGNNELVEDALLVIKESKAKVIIPVALAHAGWVAIELNRRLGRRILSIVFLEWFVLDPPQPFLNSLKGMQDQQQVSSVLDLTFNKWINGVDNASLKHFVKDEMGAYPAPMWASAARAISDAYKKSGNPLKLLSSMPDRPRVLHLYGQPDDPHYLEAQIEFERQNPWFKVGKLPAKSHFPMFEIPGTIAEEISNFIGGL